MTTLLADPTGRVDETSEDDETARAQRAIERLMAPVSWSEFTSTYQGKEPLYVSGRPDEFAQLADASRVRELIESGNPWQFRRQPELYLDGTFVPHKDLVDVYTDMDGREARAPRLKRIKKLLEAGATVNSFGQEAHFPGLAALKRNFAKAFSAEVEVATFYSQKDHQGLTPHYDCVEIFVLQISGHKRWYVSSQRVESPLVGYGTTTRYADEAPHAQIDLAPGDLLYMPRGTFHQAVALSEESLHATVAVKLPSYLDMLTALLRCAPELDAIRSDLPIGGRKAWAQSGPALFQHLQTALDSPLFVQELDRLLVVRSSG